MLYMLNNLFSKFLQINHPVRGDLIYSNNSNFIFISKRGKAGKPNNKKDKSASNKKDKNKEDKSIIPPTESNKEVNASQGETPGGANNSVKETRKTKFNFDIFNKLYSIYYPDKSLPSFDFLT